MNNQKLNNFLKNPRTNWGYILIVVILGILVGGGILGYYYWWIEQLETKITALELKLPATVTKDETVDSSRDEVLRDWKTYRNDEYGFEVKLPPTWGGIQ